MTEEVVAQWCRTNIKVEIHHGLLGHSEKLFPSLSAGGLKGDDRQTTNEPTHEPTNEP
jgi:hypothetical protein